MDDPQRLCRELLSPVREIALAAGRAILAVADQVGDPAAKSDGSPLTRADMASHRAIIEGLARLAPSFRVLSEEGDLTAVESGSWETYWCVDPLDGTKEFIAGSGEYTVNIALVQEARPILGVIHIPASRVTYWAAAGSGAWKCDRGARPSRIRPARCDRPRSAVVSRSHLSPETDSFLSRLGITDVLKRGSSLKICAVAEGAADIYPRLGPTCLWDTAAGAAIATEAGCVVVDLAGEPLTYDPRAGIKHSGFLVYPAGLANLAGPGPRAALP